jgi:MoaA/NifB/PqqE/SkfB family radical SAM enzyme
MSFARLRLAGMAEGKPRCGPGTVHIDLVNGCNTNCITCWDHSLLLDRPRSSDWKRQRMERATVERVLDDIASLGGLQAIILSGMGEPFTHPDIYEIIAAVKRRKLHLTLITNLVAADATRILELDVDQLLIGVQGASKTSYQAFHPSFVTDEWERLVEMLGLFAASGRRYKHAQVICEPNAGELVEMVRFAHRYRAAQVNFKLASLKDGTEACRITSDQRRSLRMRLIPEAARVARELGVVNNLDVLARQVDASDGWETAPIADIGCFMGYEYSRIQVDGTVLYCCNTDVRVGSLADGTRFSELWYGPEWEALRARFRRGDYFETCSQCGKLNQNVKLAERFESVFGRDKRLAVTGRS